jgi:probable F420-dependent oxidoreductase
MRFGIHLPQYGRAAGPEGITRAAAQAEDLGFSDVWVSDHLAIPATAPYPPAFLYEPLITLTWAAAATHRIGLGTSVLVLPYRHPLHLAKELASLDRLSEGRLIVGAAAGWLEAEFDALGVPFAERGPRTDEAVDVLRACWEGDQPIDFAGEFTVLEQMRVVPTPGRHIPIWIGGASAPARRRAVGRGDGWQGSFLAPEAAAAVTAKLRADRPEESFTLSMRVDWDGLADDHDTLRRHIAGYAEAGITHIVTSVRQNTIDDWLRSVEALRDLAASAT